MSYIDGCLIPVPKANKEAYLKFAEEMHALFTEYGATHLVDAWADDVPAGEVTSFPKAVKLEPDEAVVFSWMVWPSKEVRNEAWQKLEADPRMAPDVMKMPFDGKRLVFGAFETLVATPPID